MSVCVRNEHGFFFIVEMQAAMGSRRQKEAWRKTRCKYIVFNKYKLSQECFPKDEQNVLKRNWLVAYHTVIVLIINVEIIIIRPDMNETYKYRVVFIYYIGVHDR